MVAQSPHNRNRRRTGQRFRPFAEGAEFYREIGWNGVIPVSRKGTKAPLVKGITGHAGIDADDNLLAEMLAEFPWANIGLRLPFNVIGIDVDAYDGHAGAVTLDSVSRRIGGLPPTYRTTSRLPEDEVSGIYLFYAPRRHDWKWVSDLGAGSGVEIIQSHHRFATVAGSVHNKTGRPYRWFHPGFPESPAPAPGKLTRLPAAWAKYLLSSRADRIPGRTIAEGQQWFKEFHSGSRDMCDVMRHSLERALDEVRIADVQGGLHDAMIRIATHLCRNAVEGHDGLDAALSALAEPIYRAERGRGRDLRAEWYSAFKSAFANAAAQEQAKKDPCRTGSPFAGAQPIRIDK